MKILRKPEKKISESLCVKEVGPPYRPPRMCTNKVLHCPCSTRTRVTEAGIKIGQDK